VLNGALSAGAVRGRVSGCCACSNVPLTAPAQGARKQTLPQQAAEPTERSAGSPESAEPAARVHGSRSILRGGFRERNRAARARRSPESRNVAMVRRSGRKWDGDEIHVDGVGRDGAGLRRGPAVAVPRHLLPNRVRHWARGGRRRAGLNGWAQTASGSEHSPASGHDKLIPAISGAKRERKAGGRR